MASKIIHRVTMFKIPEPANIQPIMDQYTQLQQKATKGGKNYILRCVAGKTLDDPRTQGYSICAQTSFASLEDMKYYDEECQAHFALKEVVKGKAERPPLTMYFEAPAEA
ncbi:hypothetical protein AAFC00_004948 [Neodothiora populina]|uniref:Stress-response A/B barrel domain-containing protein n=1 Tax=Neodothiora populina TaxID=2781224 RepID=A0ABR3P3W6_9PEZI